MVPLYRCLSILVLTHVLFTPSQFGQVTTALEAGKPIERELKGGDAHRFTLQLAADQFFHVVADQRGIDVVLSLFAPDGSKLLDIDSPNGSKGPEAFWTIGKDAGNYTVQISSPEAADEPGKYEVLVEDIQPVTPDLRSFSQAQDLMREGMMIKSGKAAD